MTRVTVMSSTSDPKKKNDPIPPRAHLTCRECGKRLRDDDVIATDAGTVLHARCAPKRPDRLADADPDR